MVILRQRKEKGKERERGRIGSNSEGYNVRVINVEEIKVRNA